MTKMIAMLGAGIMALTPVAGFAQDAMADAVRRQVCGADAAPISAEYLANGSLRVLCPAGSTAAATGAAGAGSGAGAAGAGAAGAGAAGAQGALLAGGLTAGAAAGFATLLVVTIAVGGDGETTTTTTTTTTTN